MGQITAKRLHETLHVETLEQLEAALQEKDRKSVAGIGPRPLATLRAALSQMLTRIRPIRLGPADEPPVDVLLNVDREYRAKVKAKELRTIGEAQRTIVSETRGVLAGQRVVRGPVRECLSVYERAAS